MISKQQLLDLDIFIDNEFLDKYVELVNNNSMEKIKYCYQNHHIIPKSYFKHFNKPVDNSKCNIVTLSHFNHVLAHLYLWGCAKDSWFSYANAEAVRYALNNRYYRNSNVYETEKYLFYIREDYQNSQKEAIKYRSESHKNFRHSEETKLKLSLIKKEYYKTHCGTMNGKHHSLESKQKMSKSAKKRHSNFKGKHHSYETKQKISSKNLGKTHADATKQKISLIEKSQFASGTRKSWNSGLDKSDDRVKAQSIKLKAKWDSGELSRAGNNHSGRIYINNGENQLFIKKELLEDYEKLGYSKGKLHPKNRTPEQKLKISEGMKRRKQRQC